MPMKTFTSSLSLLLASGLLAGCMQMPVKTAAIGEDGCVGETFSPYGLSETQNDALLQQARQPEGKGGLCKGKVFTVQQPLTVYRVWDSTNPNTQLGRWWSFLPPAGPVNAYRADNAICPEWSALNKVSQCRLKAGVQIVVGPGQSAQCQDLRYPQSSNNQVFVPNDTRNPNDSKVLVTDCVVAADWP